MYKNGNLSQLSHTLSTTPWKHYAHYLIKPPGNWGCHKIVRKQ